MLVNPMYTKLRGWLAALLAAAPLALAALPAAATAPSFIEFESGQVRPIAMSPDGKTLFAVNTPDDMLAIFNITDSGLTLKARVPVGLEPVAVATRGNNEVWVVNHLSDSVSVVSLTGTPHVVHTLLVGDEPNDIVFAGNSGRAFITTAHRGQQRTDPSIANVPGAGDPQLTTPGIGRADVWVFDPANLGNTVGGTPVKIISLFGDSPRALAVSPDKNTVYAAVLASGNQTTVAGTDFVCDGFDKAGPCRVRPDTPPFGNNRAPGGLPPPSTDASGEQAPENGLIVKFNKADGHWEDTLGRNWDNAIRFKLPDKDVFAIDANSLNQTADFTGVGTTLFNMVTNPVNGNVYVSNSDSHNLTRFEGQGVFGGSTVQGHLAEMRITVLKGSSVLPRHLNKQINYSLLATDPNFDPSVKSESLSTPLDMAVTSDGKTLYVAAFGSSEIGVFDTKALEDDTFDPRTTSANYIPVSGGGPSGVVLDEARNRLYVMTRFDDSVKVIDLATKTEVAAETLPNPEPASVVKGRPFLYDAQFGSANGEASCASCHIFGDKDELAWDLGNPDSATKTNPIPKKLADNLSVGVFKQVTGFPASPLNGVGDANLFHPMKGPMTTLTLRGLVNDGAEHWRGDRSNGFFGIDNGKTPPFDSRLAFMNFIEAFQDLNGRKDLPTTEQMTQFTDFALQIQMPPNPVRNLDDSLTPSQQAGSDFYFGKRLADGTNLIANRGFNCNGCHVVDPAQGFFGTDGEASFEGIPQIMKIPELRNLYSKVGMFGFPDTSFFLDPESGNTGDQVRGFGFVHSGEVDTIFRFLSATVFKKNLLSIGVGIPDAQTRRDLEQFILAFPSDLAPIVGQQVTLTSTNSQAVGPRIDLLEQRAAAPFVSKELGGNVTECDLVAKVALNGAIKGYLFDTGAGNWQAGDGSGNTLADSALRGLAATPGQEVTFTCTPPGSGSRIASNS